MSESRLTLTLNLMSVELSCALLWALSGTFAAGALALTLGLGTVLVVFLPERYPPRGEAPRTTLLGRTVNSTGSLENGR